MDDMPRARGRAIVLASGLLGLAVLAVAGFVFRDRVVEEYWLWKLEQGDESDREAAARKLGELRSGRAVPGLLRWVDSAKRRPADEAFIFYVPGELLLSGEDASVQVMPEHDVFNRNVSRAAYRIAKAAFLSIGEGAVPRLTRLSGEEDADSTMRFWARAMIGELNGKPVVGLVRRGGSWRSSGSIPIPELLEK